jgi:hypothetical protein
MQMISNSTFAVNEKDENYANLLKQAKPEADEARPAAVGKLLWETMRRRSDHEGDVNWIEKMEIKSNLKQHVNWKETNIGSSLDLQSALCHLE